MSMAGNENFTLVENSAGVLQNLQTTSEQSVESKIQKLTVYDENFAKEVVGLGTIYTVTGYAPDNFGTTGGGHGVFLNRVPKGPAATSATADQLLLLPNGATIIGMRITNNGTTITGNAGSSLNIDCQDWTETSNAVGGSRLALQTPTGANGTTGEPRGVNSAAGVKFWPANFTASGMTLGSAGQDQGSTYLSKADSVVVTESTRHVGVLVNSQALTAGDLAVKLWYIAP